jgi:2-haloacid dehalogenase
MTTIAFDVYGTLIDTHGLVADLKALVGDKAASFSQTWREKQLEYAFRRGLMQSYAPFSVCTRQALNYCCEVYQADLTGGQKEALLASYQVLPAFADVAAGLERLAGYHRLFAFSNGTLNRVETLLNNADIRGYFQGIVTVDDVESFKPNPAVYKHFLQASGAKANETWLISSNPFDVIGAKSAGMQAVWVKRDKNAIFDPWGIEPDSVVEDFSELVRTLARDAQAISA